MLLIILKWHFSSRTRRFNTVLCQFILRPPPRSLCFFPSYLMWAFCKRFARQPDWLNFATWIKLKYSFGGYPWYCPVCCVPTTLRMCVNVIYRFQPQDPFLVFPFCCCKICFCLPSLFSPLMCKLNTFYTIEYPVDKSFYVICVGFSSSIVLFVVSSSRWFTVAF